MCVWFKTRGPYYTLKRKVAQSALSAFHSKIIIHDPVLVAITVQQDIFNGFEMQETIDSLAPTNIFYSDDLWNCFLTTIFAYREELILSSLSIASVYIWSQSISLRDGKV